MGDYICNLLNYTVVLTPGYIPVYSIGYNKGIARVLGYIYIIYKNDRFMHTIPLKLKLNAILATLLQTSNNKNEMFE